MYTRVYSYNQSNVRVLPHPTSTPATLTCMLTRNGEIPVDSRMGGTIALPDSEDVEVRIRLSTSVRVEERDVLNAWRSKGV